MTSFRARTIVAALSLVALLLALAVPLAADLHAALVPALPALALLECTGAAHAECAPRKGAGWAAAPGARGPPSLG